MVSKGLRFPVRLHEKLKRATTLYLPLKSLLAIQRVAFSFQYV